jgi:hypothetical protein
MIDDELRFVSNFCSQSCLQTPPVEGAGTGPISRGRKKKIRDEYMLTYKSAYVDIHQFAAGHSEKKKGNNMYFNTPLLGRTRHEQRMLLDIVV